MLRLTNVSAGYGKKEIIQNISLDIGAREILAVIGINGSGKSTLLKTCLGLLPPIQGQIFVEEKSLNTIPLSSRSSLISMLESQSKVSFTLSVRELLEMAPSGHDPRLFQAALEATGLGGYESKDVLKLSNGERQRAFVAHALMTPSKIILLDEPLSHLDWSHQVQLIRNLKKWRDTFSTAFVVALHELERALQLADRIAVMDQGRLLTVGPPAEVFKSQAVLESFAFSAAIDENPLDGSPRLTLGQFTGEKVAKK